MARRNLFQKARDWLPQQVQAAAGVPDVTYTRPGSGSITLTAVLGDTLFSQNDEGASKIIWRDGDFLIAAADLTFGTPRNGDKIALTLGGQTAVFEVGDGETGRPAWRWSDRHQTQYRIHTTWKKPT